MSSFCRPYSGQCAADAEPPRHHHGAQREEEEEEEEEDEDEEEEEEEEERERERQLLKPLIPTERTFVQ